MDKDLQDIVDEGIRRRKAGRIQAYCLILAVIIGVLSFYQYAAS